MAIKLITADAVKYINKKNETRMYMRRCIGSLLIAVAAITAQAAQPASFANESLNYQIVYHWGVVWKHAANATLSIRAQGDYYNARLTARTLSWADKVYSVRDTLSCRLLKAGLKPVRYVKSTMEGGEYGLDVVDYSYAGSTVTGKCARTRSDKPTQHVTVQSTGPTYDMVSIFYYLRCLDFSKLAPGKAYTATIFSGKRKERIALKSKGVETIELRDKSKHRAYHVAFNFTTEGGKKSSDDIDVWITTDDRRIPLMLVGQIAVGEIRCYYSGKL